MYFFVERRLLTIRSESLFHFAFWFYQSRLCFCGHYSITIISIMCDRLTPRNTIMGGIHDGVMMERQE